MDRNLALESVRLIEAQKFTSAQWMGKGSPIATRDVAIKTRHRVFSSNFINDRIIIGKREPTEASTLLRDRNSTCRFMACGYFLEDRPKSLKMNTERRS